MPKYTIGPQIVHNKSFIKPVSDFSRFIIGFTLCDSYYIFFSGPLLVLVIEGDPCNREVATAVPPLDLVVGDHTVLVVAGAVGDIIVERGIVIVAEVIVVLTGGTNVVQIDTAQGIGHLHQEDRTLVPVLQPTIENLTMIG